MVSKSATRASQRLVLNNDNCNSIFRIPSHLVKSYGEKLPSKVRLRVDDSGKKWVVSIEKFKDHYFFTNGWKEFAEQVDLKSLHFLKFKYGESKQNGKNKRKRSGSDVKATSSVLDENKGKNKKKRSGDVKSSSILNQEKGEDSGDVNGTKSSILNVNKNKCSPVETTLIYSKEMKKYHQYSVDIPKDIVFLLGLRNEDKIKLKDLEGREWPVVVRKRNCTLSLMKGWGDFVKENKVMLGSTISFSWLSGETLQVEIVEAGTDKQPLYSIRNNRKRRLQASDF